MTLPAALVNQDDDLVPITICITPPQAVRLELLLADAREINPELDDSDVLDAIFLYGLKAAEAVRFS